MTAFKSKKELINKSAELVYEFLSKAENYHTLMPSNVRSFVPSKDGASIDIEGLGVVELAFVTKNPHSYLELRPQNKVPFNFNLSWNIEALSENQCNIEAVINAELNFMMRMMAEKLLTQFLDVQVHKLKEQMDND